MTLEEAKKQLDRYRQVIRKTTHLQKKGEPGHQQQLAQFKRKRSALLEHLDEAEVLVREADPDYYRRWVDDIIEKPDSWELHADLRHGFHCTSFASEYRLPCGTAPPSSLPFLPRNPSDNLIHYLLGYGTAIEVLSPQVLKEATGRHFL